MDGFAFADIIFFALLAAYILNRLRATLGQDDGTRLPTGNPFTASKVQQKKPEVDSAKAAAIAAVKNEPIVKPQQKTYPEPKIEDQALLEKIGQIKSQEPAFTAGYFLYGAQMAYEMIMEGFAKGDKETLKDLLAPELYKSFADEIDNRAKAEEFVETTLVSIDSSVIKDVAVRGKTADIIVTFKSEQINFTKNKDGKLVDGNSSSVERVEDFITFRRELGSANPNWTVVSIEN